MFCRPLYRSTRLNGTPIQMLAMITEINDHVGEVNQSTDEPPTDFNAELTTPDSLLSIQAQVEADTIKGSSHGTRNSARRVAERRKFCAKNTASARPIVNWKAMETKVNISVWIRAGLKVGSRKIVR